MFPTNLLFCPNTASVKLTIIVSLIPPESSVVPSSDINKILSRKFELFDPTN